MPRSTGWSTRPASGFSGADSLSISLSDPGDSLSASHTVAFSVKQPPWFGGPAFAWTNENTTLTFSAAKGNALTVADSAAGTTGLELTLTAANGKVQVFDDERADGRVGRQRFRVGDGQGNAGQASTQRLKGLVFTPTSGYAGTAAALLFSIKDLGDQTDRHGGDRDLRVCGPKIHGPRVGNRDRKTLRSSFPPAASNAIGIVDAAAAKGGNVQLTLTATHGTLSLATTAGLTFTDGRQQQGLDDDRRHTQQRHWPP